MNKLVPEQEITPSEEIVCEAPAVRRSIGAVVTGVAPGLFLTGTIAALAFALRELPGVAILSPMIIATFLGMALHNLVGMPDWAKAGVIFSLRRVLRLGIILLGFQLVLTQVLQVGVTGVAVILASLVGTFLFTK